MGRTGALWGHEQLRIIPDVYTSAKALGGGLPIAAMTARGDADTRFGPGDHASTCGGQPLVCAAGFAVAQYMCDHNILDNDIKPGGEQLEAGLKKIPEKCPTVSCEVRGWGLLHGVGVISDDIEPANLVGTAAMKENLLLVPAGYNVVRFVPPLIISEAEINLALECSKGPFEIKDN
jgi:acetylornithine aminotransferase